MGIDALQAVRKIKINKNVCSKINWNICVLIKTVRMTVCI